MSAWDDAYLLADRKDLCSAEVFHAVARARDESRALEAEVATLREALGAIARNAESWHGNGEEGPRKALVVIARWARDPATIPTAVLAAATPAAEEKA